MKRGSLPSDLVASVGDGLLDLLLGGLGGVGGRHVDELVADEQLSGEAGIG